jgi:hypothetical protein
VEGLLVCPALGLLGALRGGGSLGLDLNLGLVLLGLSGLLGANGQGLLCALLCFFSLLGTGDRLSSLGRLAGAVTAAAAGLYFLGFIGMGGGSSVLLPVKDGLDGGAQRGTLLLDNGDNVLLLGLTQLGQLLQRGLHIVIGAAALAGAHHIELGVVIDAGSLGSLSRRT